MRNLRLTLTLIVIACITAFFACSKYSDTNSSSSPTELPADKTVTASVQGVVLDENGAPVQGAVVTSGASSVTTGANGTFLFMDIPMSSRFGFVKAVKAGYFTGSRSIITAQGGSNYLSIRLIPKVSKGTFAAASGGKITVQQGDSVSFDATSVVNAATNAAYTGTVHVFAAYLDPTDALLFQRMPGDLRGIGTDGKETVLQSFGMMAVELEGDAGEKLQIAPGKKATLSMTIPAKLQATAPASIPLWYFNDTTGKWIEQGSAARQGNTYIGQVAHFSFWNYDAPVDVVNFKMVLKDQHGNPLPYIFLEMLSQHYGTRGAYTDSAGYAGGLIPKGEMLQLRAYSKCGTLLVGVNVGPAFTDQDLGTVTATLVDARLSLSGTVVDCSNAAVTNGYVNIGVEGRNYRVALNKGAFSLDLSRCTMSATSVTLTAFNLSTQDFGQSETSADTGVVNLGQLTACGGTVDQYVKVNVESNAINILSPPDNVGYSYDQYSNKDFFGATTSANDQAVYFRLPNLTATGTVALDSMYIQIPNAYYYQKASLSCTVSTFGPVGGYIEGSFSGTLYNQSSAAVPASGSFRVKRTF